MFLSYCCCFLALTVGGNVQFLCMYIDVCNTYTQNGPSASSDSCLPESFLLKSSESLHLHVPVMTSIS